MNTRRRRLGDASWAAGNDDAGNAVEVIGAGIYRKDVALDTGFADAAREQVTVLSARVENCDSVHEWIIVRQSSVGSLQSAVGSR